MPVDGYSSVSLRDETKADLEQFRRYLANLQNRDLSLSDAVYAAIQFAYEALISQQKASQ